AGRRRSGRRGKVAMRGIKNSVDRAFGSRAPSRGGDRAGCAGGPEGFWGAVARNVTGGGGGGSGTGPPNSIISRAQRERGGFGGKRYGSPQLHGNRYLLMCR